MSIYLTSDTHFFHENIRIWSRVKYSSSEIFSCKNFNNTISTCSLVGYQNDKRWLFVATELNNNDGCSVSNGAECLWKEVLNKYNLQLKNCIFIETYIYTDTPQHWDRVFYDPVTDHVSWSPIENYTKILYDFRDNKLI